MDILTRTDFLENGIFGIMECNHVARNFSTIEHAYPGYPDGPQYPITYQPKVPPGVYTCKRGIHHLPWKSDVLLGEVLEALGAALVKINDTLCVKFETFEITGVPGHNNILFHWGNFNDDSDGCVCLGMGRAPNMVTSSRTAFSNFMDAKAGIDEYQLTVK